METAGYRIKLHSALVTPIMLGGVPRQFAILNGTVCAAFVLGLHAIYTLPLFIIIHIVAVIAARRDPYFFEIIMRQMRKKKFYDV